ncbi:hypothetical protein EB001_07805 [bacterium]|nr:hypothetical protein [bacterium]
MQQLSLYEIVCICSSVGYIISDTILNKLRLDINKTTSCFLSMLGGDIAIWIIADPYPLKDIQWVIASISSFLSVYIIESFIEFRKKTTTHSDTRIDEILNIVRKLDK